MNKKIIEPEKIEPQTELNKKSLAIEKVKARQKVYRAKNRKKYNELSKNYRLNNAEKIKQYKIDNADKIKEQTKKYKLNKAY